MEFEPRWPFATAAISRRASSNADRPDVPSRKPAFLPSGLQAGIPLIIQKDWTPAQVVAVVELLDDLREVIYRHYQPQIQEYMRQDRRTKQPLHGQHQDDQPF